MKLKLLYPVLICFSSVVFAQQQVSAVDGIKDKIEIIDTVVISDELSLDPEEFLTRMADHGAELRGFYEHDRLKKMIRHIGVPGAMLITTYYFWNGNLVYVHYVQNQYMKERNANGAVVLDYSNSFLKYESKHYFQNDEEIDKVIVGTPIPGIEPDEEFVDYANRMKSLLDNKYKNKNIYDTLQGKWIDIESPGNALVFQETIQVVFRDSKFYKRQRVKIEDDIMYCSSPKNKYVYRYKIRSINERELVLQDLQNQSSEELFTYRKEDQY